MDDVRIPQDARTEVFQRAIFYKRIGIFTPNPINRYSLPDGIHQFYTFGKEGSERTPAIVTTSWNRAHFTGSVLTAYPVKIPEGKGLKYFTGRVFGILRGAEYKTTLREYMAQYAKHLPYAELTLDMRPMREPAELRLFQGSTDKEHFTRTGCAGYWRFDFGKEGNRHWSTRHDKDLSFWGKTLPQEVDPVLEELQNCGPLRTRGHMMDFTWNRREAKLPPLHNENRYGYVIETDNYSLYLVCMPDPSDYDAYCYVYQTDQLQQYLATIREAEQADAQEADVPAPGMSL